MPRSDSRVYVPDSLSVYTGFGSTPAAARANAGGRTHRRPVAAPWAPEPSIARNISNLTSFDGFTPQQLRGVERDNALPLFPDSLTGRARAPAGRLKMANRRVPQSPSGRFPGGSTGSAHAADRTARIRDGCRARLFGAAGQADGRPGVQAGCGRRRLRPGRWRHCRLSR